MRSAIKPLLRQTVTRRAFVARDAYGSPTYGDPQALRASVQYGRRRVIDRDGQDAVSEGRVFLDVDVAVSLDDELVLPDGSTPRLLHVTAVHDPVTGRPHHYEVAF